MARILVTDDERSMREFLEILLLKEGHEVLLAENAAKAIALAKEKDPDLVITDLRLGQSSGLDVLAEVKKARPDIEVIMMTAFGTTEIAVQAMKLGACDYIEKPFKGNDKLRVVIQKALEKRQLVAENRALRSRLEDRDRFTQLVGRSPPMREVFTVIEKVAPTRTTVLITGESGVGKELVARALHERSSRAAAPFVAVNCGAIPEGLLESELFGHVKGAFTGAAQSKAGLFVAATNGTLFLDEIGELPLPLQVKLLRVLQDRRVKPVGGVDDVEVDARIIAATNRDLQAEVKAGRFREDLFYRLNVIQVKVPPLRDRREDILLLAEHFLQKFAREHGRDDVTLSKVALAALSDYSFPGNVRELENIIERSVTLSEGPVIEVRDLPASVRAQPQILEVATGEIPNGFDLQKYLDDVEQQYLERALGQANGIKLEAAKLLGLTFRSFRYRLKKALGPAGGDEDDIGDEVTPQDSVK
jgi:two-component system response regulator PilR (NtrC family)